MPLTPDQQAVLNRWLYDASDRDGLIADISKLNVEAFLQRLKELGQQIGITPGALDRVVEEELAKRAAFAAQSVVDTHNADLRALLEKLDPNEDASEAVLRWETERADWKGRQIAFNEAMTARNIADQRFRGENDIVVRMRVVPEEAVCPICQGYVDMGYMDADTADGIDLPAHINCQHGWAYGTGLSHVLDDRETVWLGSQVKRDAEAA